MEVCCNYSYDDCTNMSKCTVTAITADKPDVAIKSFNESSKYLTRNSIEVASIRFLHMEKQNVKFFPRNIELTFPALSRLIIKACGLTEISRSNLKGLWGLNYLNLSGNKLTTLPDDLFADMRNLWWIYFQNNKLRFLTSRLLKPIEKTVTIADFSNNVRLNDYFNKQVAAKNNLQSFMESIDKNCLNPEKKMNQKSDRLDYMQANFEKFRISSKFSDFTIKLRGKSYEVHKCVLAAQSSVFEEMFSNDPAELDQPFKNVKNFSNKAFESFLNYFYTGRVNAGGTPVEMIQLASEFKVPDLKTKCIDRILENLGETNALEIFNLGHEQESEELIQTAFDFIKRLHPFVDDELRNDKEALNKLFNIDKYAESW